jgi:hypothetical protein
MKIRSLFLSDMPPDIQTIRRRTLILRWVTVGAMAIFFLTVIILISGRMFAADGLLGRVLYGLHDNVFLVLRGEIFALLIYPFGFIALFLAFYLGLFVFIPWLFAFSFIRRAYHVVWGRMIDRITLHPFVIQSVSLSSIVTVWLRLLPLGTAYRGDVPRMIAQTHRQNLRMQLWDSANSDTTLSEQTVNRYIAMLSLTIRLETRLPEREQHVDSQLQGWHLALLLLQLNHAESQAVDQMIQAVKGLPLQKIVADTPAEMLEMLKPSTLISRLEDILSLFPHAPIYPQNLLDKVSQVSLVELEQSTNTPQPSRYDVVTRLVGWVEDCTTIYTDLAYHLQSQFEQRIETPEWRSFPDPDDMPLSYTAIGQLVFQMAVHIAYITQQTNHATALLEAQQALMLALDAAQADNSLRPDGAYWLGLVDGASQPDIGEMMYPYEAFGILAMLQQAINGQRNAEQVEQLFTEKTLPNIDKHLTTSKLYNQMGRV